MRLLITIGLFATWTASYSCSCGHVGILRGQKGAEFVFAGRVTNIKEVVTEETTTGTNEKIQYRRYEYTFNVKSIFKGKKKWTEYRDKIVIITTGGDADCGNIFDLKKKYLVYSYRANNKLGLRISDQKTNEFMTTNLCTRTKRTNLFTIFEKLILRLS